MLKLRYFNLTFLIAFGLLLFAKNEVEGKPKLVCYFSNWEAPPPDESTLPYDEDDVPYDLCDTLVWYHDTISTDQEYSIIPRRGEQFSKRFLRFARNRNLPVYLGIGGYGLNLAELSALSDSGKRSRFASNIQNFMSQRSFNGLLIDWGYPSVRDVFTFPRLLESLRQPFRAKNWTLAITGASDRNIIKTGYDLDEINKYVDEVHVNCHHFPDFFTMPTVVKDHSPLYTDPEALWTYSVESVMRYWSEYIPKEKLYVAVYIPGITRGKAIEDIKGPYFEVCTYVEVGIFKEKWNPVTKTAHAIGQEPFTGVLLSYENVESLREKAKFVRDKGYGGIAFKFVNDDDFRGICGKKNPLVTAVRETFK